MRVLVTGSRTWWDAPRVHVALNERLAAAHERGEEFTLVHGDAVGADRIAHEWAVANRVTIERHPYWSRYGKAGGPMRNQHMVDRGADVVLAFIKGGSKGATGCAVMARLAGLHVEIHREEERAWPTS